MTIPISRLVLGAVILLPIAARAQTGHAKVKIVAPANGATVSGPVKVVLQATGKRLGGNGARVQEDEAGSRKHPRAHVSPRSQSSVRRRPGMRS